MGMLNLGVSDIQIDGPLGFQLNNLIKLKQKHPVKIRVQPTISASASLNAPAAIHFFIRPEDLSLYEPAIDILDLRQPDPEVENTIFSIYSNREFIGNIDKIIKNVPKDTFNPALVSSFAENRLNCG